MNLRGNFAINPRMASGFKRLICWNKSKPPTLIQGSHYSPSRDAELQGHTERYVSNKKTIVR